MKIRNLLILAGFYFPTVNSAVIISPDRQKIENTINLTADINISDDNILGPVQLQVLTSLNETAQWNVTNNKFNDLGLLVRVERANPSPLNIDVIGDGFQCLFGNTLVSRQSNASFLIRANYEYYMRNNNGQFNNSRYIVEEAAWQKINTNNYSVDLDIGFSLPQIDPKNLVNLTKSRGNCMGNVVFMITLRP